MWARYGLMALVIASVACEPAVEDTEPIFEFTAMETEVHDLVNAHRQSIGLAPLTEEPAIGVESRIHSDNMLAGTTKFGHDGFDGRADRIGASVAWVAIGENVATNMGYADPVATAVEGWLNSPPHKENMEGDFNLAGVGIAETDGYYYFTQIFALVQ